MIVAPGAVLEILVQGQASVNGQLVKVQNVFHYGQTSPVGTIGAKQDYMNSFGAQVLAAMAATLSVDYQANAVLSRFLTNYFDPYETLAGFAPLAGAIAGDSLPTKVAARCGLGTNLRGRSEHGTKHFSPVAESDTVQGQINGVGPIGRWTTLRDALLPTIAGAGGTQALVPMIVSKKLSTSTPAGTTIYVSTATTATLNLTLGTMRRRREKTVLAA